VVPWLFGWADKDGWGGKDHDYNAFLRGEFQDLPPSSKSDGFLITGVPPDGLGVVDFNIGAGRRMLAKGVEAVNDSASRTYLQQDNKDQISPQAAWPDKTIEELWIYLDAWIDGTGDQHNVEWSVRARNRLLKREEREDNHYYSDLALVTRNEEGKLTVTDKRQCLL
jgi:hypothetical protein